MKTPKIINAIELIDTELIENANKAEKKPFYIKPVFKRATAIAACLAIVAVSAFALTNKTNKNISSNNNANSDNISSNNISSNNSGETSSGNKKVIYVTGDTSDEEVADGDSIKSLKLKYISRKLQEEMDFYKDYKEKEVVYCVIMEIFIGGQDYDEGGKIAKASPEAEALYQQYLAAREEEDKAEADWRAFNKANPGDEPEVVEKRKELIAICDEKKEIRMNARAAWEDLRHEIVREYCSARRQERLDFAYQYCKYSPERTLYDDSKFYVELSDEEINTLAEKGGYAFRLASEKDCAEPD